jgi:urease accessory protein
MNITEMMRVLQFGDSLLPIGSFTFSNGVESAIQARQVTDRDTLQQFVQTTCRQVASADGIALLEAHRAARARDIPRIVRADQAIYNRKLNEETRVMSARLGKKLAETANYVLAHPLLETWLGQISQGNSPGCYPIALGLTFAAQGLPEQDAFAVQHYGTAMMMLSASLRLMRLSYLDAQAIAYEINRAAKEEYDRHRAATLEDMAVFAPTRDILAAAHIHAHVRLFMT